MLKTTSFFACKAGVILLICCFNQCFGQVNPSCGTANERDLNCNRAASEVNVCPIYAWSSATRNELECSIHGCYYCDNFEGEKCVEGVGCSRIGLSLANECKDVSGFRILNRFECKNMGCSWCESASGAKCYTNPTSRDDIIVPPASSTLNCVSDAALRVECDYLDSTRAADKLHCAESGCHWCPTGPGVPCIKGQVCSTQKNTGEYDCRHTPTEVLTRYECLQRDCSWCPNNAAFKCVRDIPVGVSDLNCMRSINEVEPCPNPSGFTWDAQQCRDEGCYFCSGLPTPCVKGVGCSRLDMSPTTACKTSSGTIISNKQLCRAQGCSWCDDHTGIKCFTNPTSKSDIITVPSPYSGDCSAASRTECQYIQSEYANTRTQCWVSGCHWCPISGNPISCIQGEVCGTPRSTLEYDCRDSPSESLTPYECKQRGCSWCPDNIAYKCVRDLPDTPQTCTGTESLQCLPYPTPLPVTEAQCDNEYRCSYCGAAVDTMRCMRSECPPGWQLRYDGNSCCRAAKAPSDTGPTISHISNSNIVRIIGGSNAQEGQWSWMGHYTFGIAGVIFSCGSFIVAPKIAITAAHCQVRDLSTFKIIGPGTGSVEVGSTVLSQGVTIPVVEQISHPFYSDGHAVHDIMILKLLWEVPPSVEFLSLPLGEAPPVGMTCVVVGWGATVGLPVPIPSPVLKEAFQIILDAPFCKFSISRFDDKFQACANEATSGSCVGDSGGPLMCQRCSSCEWYAHGIVSTGSDLACNPLNPATYTKVDPYLDFLVENGVPVGSRKYNCDTIF